MAMKRKTRRTISPGEAAVEKMQAKAPPPSSLPALAGNHDSGLDVSAAFRSHREYNAAYGMVALRIMAEGGSLYSVAREIGCSRKTLWAWAEKYPQFRAILEAGEDMARGWWEDVGRLNLHNKFFVPVLWMMNMTSRFGWSRAITGGEPGDPGQPAQSLQYHQHLTLNVKELPTDRLRELREVVARKLEETPANADS